MSGLLLCTDLDRTLLPNGSQPESEQARKKFHELVKQPQVTLVYVTVRQARNNHQLNTLYLAQENFLGMNGNYSTGILEDVANFFPQAEFCLRGGA